MYLLKILENLTIQIVYIFLQLRKKNENLTKFYKIEKKSFVFAMITAF